MKIDFPPVRRFDESVIFPGEEVLDAATACLCVMLHLTAEFAHDGFDLAHCSVEGFPNRDQRVCARRRQDRGARTSILAPANNRLSTEAGKSSAQLLIPTDDALWPDELREPAQAGERGQRTVLPGWPGDAGQGLLGDRAKDGSNAAFEMEMDRGRADSQRLGELAQAEPICADAQ